MNNRIKIAVGAGILALIIACASGVYYYFNVRTQTPEYTMKLAEKAFTDHDKKDFYRAVNIESLIDSSYESFVEAFTGSDTTMSPEAKDAVKNFTQMLKAPLMMSLKAAVDSYIENGDFNGEENVGVSELLGKTGIDKMEFRGIDEVVINDADKNEALANVRIFQPELKQEFVLRFLLHRNDSGQWQIVSVQNFQDFITRLNEERRTQLDEYLEKISDINSRHDRTIREAEQKYGSILSLGSLGQSDTRADLKVLMLDVVKKDWEVRKQEIFSLNVPTGAETLQSIEMKICDLSIEYADDYGKWMEDKKAATIKSAEEKRHQAEILKTEAAALAGRMAK